MPFPNEAASRVDLLIHQTADPARGASHYVFDGALAVVSRAQVRGAAVSPDLYRHGVAVVTAMLVALIVLALVVDGLLLVRRQPPLGYWLRAWARHSPLYRLLVVLLLAAFLGHLVLHPPPS